MKVRNTLTFEQRQERRQAKRAAAEEKAKELRSMREPLGCGPQTIKKDIAARERDTQRVQKMPEVEPTKLRIAQIRADGGTQMRAGLNDATVDEYAEVIYAQKRILDWPFPPLEVYYDGQDYWLADGFHRFTAFCKALKIGMRDPDLAHTLPAIVHAGDRRQAILHAAGANADHGLRRTNADKRRAVETLLRDEEWQQWSNRAIAAACAVSLDLVNRIREELSERIVQMPTERKVTRKGKTYTQETKNIGRGLRPAHEQPTPILSEEELAAEEQAAMAEVEHEREEEEQERLDKERLTFAEWWALMPKDKIGLREWVIIFETAKAGASYVRTWKPGLSYHVINILVPLSSLITAIEKELKK